MKIAFYLASLGELQFLKPVMKLLESRNPDLRLLVVHYDTDKSQFDKLYGIPNRFRHIKSNFMQFKKSNGIDLFITSEQYRGSLPSVYSICMFHGQPSKGLTFTKKILSDFDAFFLYGPLHHDALNEFLADNNLVIPETLTLFDVGYPKSDALINGELSKHKIASDLKLDRSKRTVLYAPAFNEGASLREYGIEIIETLLRCDKYNVLVKLPIDCWEPISNEYATGGINWFTEITRLEQHYDNLCFYREYEIDPLMACADVMVTCISSVGFEFMALNKPVVFIETPKYYTEYLQNRIPEHSVEKWANRTTVNGGKEFGLTVNTVAEIPSAIDLVLQYPTEYPRQQERLKTYLIYNRGNATKAATFFIEKLLTDRATSKRLITSNQYSKRLWSRVNFKIRTHVYNIINRQINAWGYTLERSGCGYIDAKTIVDTAKSKGLSICELLESRESDPRKIGRRNLIIKIMDQYGLFSEVNRVCEIGAGTGQYLEKVLEYAKPSIYEVYETDRGWVKFLNLEYGKLCNLQCHPADGKSLFFTKSESIDLVHSHAVFVYLPLLRIVEYLKEFVRVCRTNGFIVFDCFLDSAFCSLKSVDTWLKTEHRFPVVIPSKLIEEFAAINGLYLVHRFQILYGASTSNYFIYKKMGTKQNGSSNYLTN